MMLEAPGQETEKRQSPARSPLGEAGRPGT